MRCEGCTSGALSLLLLGPYWEEASFTKGAKLVDEAYVMLRADNRGAKRVPSTSHPGAFR